MLGWNGWHPGHEAFKVFVSCPLLSASPVQMDLQPQSLQSLQFFPRFLSAKAMPVAAMHKEQGADLPL